MRTSTVGPLIHHRFGKTRNRNLVMYDRSDRVTPSHSSILFSPLLPGFMVFSMYVLTTGGSSNSSFLPIESLQSLRSGGEIHYFLSGGCPCWVNVVREGATSRAFFLARNPPRTPGKQDIDCWLQK